MIDVGAVSRDLIRFLVSIRERADYSCPANVGPARVKRIVVH